MTTNEYQYDVAFSFLAVDESLATRLNELIQDRVSTFLYSKRQEEIAGTDGEESFNKVFGEQARIVVVLYRSGWGDTPWTRIEQTAIRNRAYDEGYGFVLFIPLDKPGTVPKWLPKTQLWIGLGRWGADGAASVIEARVQEAGGSPRQETLEERVQRLKREIDAEARRKAVLGSIEGVEAADEEVQKLHDHLQTQVALVREKASFNLAIECDARTATVRGANFAVAVDWYRRFANTLDNSKLEVALWSPSPPRPGMFFPFEKPRRLDWREFDFDRDWSGANGWRERGKSELLSTERLAETCVTFLMEAIHSNQLKDS